MIDEGRVENVVVGICLGCCDIVIENEGVVSWLLLSGVEGRVLWAGRSGMIGGPEIVSVAPPGLHPDAFAMSG